MNFRDELKRKKYEITENEEVEIILKKLLDYFEEECFKKGIFSEKVVHFKYKLKHVQLSCQILITCEIASNKIFEQIVKNAKVFELLKEKFRDEGYDVNENQLSYRDFSVIIKP